MNNCRCGMQGNMFRNASDRRCDRPAVRYSCGEDERSRCDFTPVMAYVPWQEWGEQFGEMEALMNGTLFKSLVKPFIGGRN